MKKHLILMLGILLCSKLFSNEVNFAFGANVGSAVTQKIENTNKQKMIYALPFIGLSSEAVFDKFGIRTDFSIGWESKNSYSSSTSKDESVQKNYYENLLFTPFVHFEHERFIFTIGPTFGFSFAQTYTKLADYDLEYYAAIFCMTFGGTIGAKYSITNHCLLYLDLPVLADNFIKIVSEQYSDSTEVSIPSASWTASTLYVIPKIGLMYRF